jgi:MFS family permease
MRRWRIDAARTRRSDQHHSESMAMSGRRNFWVPVICGALILTIGIGARQSFGIFQKPIAADLNVGRELWSFGTALAMLLMGAFSPFVGNLADRFGTARTVAAGGMLYVAGMLMIALATEGVMLTVGNVLSGVGLAAAGFGPIFGAIARQTPPAQRSVALGVATAGGSFGQFAIVPIASILQNRFDNWHMTMFVLTALSALMVVLSFGLREDRRASSVPPGMAGTQTARDALEEAFRTQGFWLLTIGFFVCGFHVSFIGLHLPSYISDNSVGMYFFGRPISALELGGWAIGLVGLFNIAGSLIWRYSMRFAPWRSCCFLRCRCPGSPCCCLRLPSGSCGWARFR